jgi:hypothetical protein
MIAIGYWTLAGGSNNKNNDLSRKEESRPLSACVRSVGKDPLAPELNGSADWIQKIFGAPLAPRVFVPYCRRTFRIRN